MFAILASFGCLCANPTSDAERRLHQRESSGQHAQCFSEQRAGNRESAQRRVAGRGDARHRVDTERRELEPRIETEQ
eukprot:5706609-Pleurochrysis_carterae.AAC.3